MPISQELDQDYAYTIKVLHNMHVKGWLDKGISLRNQRKKYYNVREALSDKLVKQANKIYEPIRKQEKQEVLNGKTNTA